ncbi:MAG TPA: S9 family peptidase [Usitatibacter sp.]|nr:S9 family peptidase [Usitatibacter sp.]
MSPSPRARPIDIDTLWKLQRVGNVALAPDGSAAVCSVTRFSMDENKSSASLWLLPGDSCAPRQLTRCGDTDGKPSWSPRGDRIAFLARREQEGRKDAERQLYVIPLAGGEAERKSDFAPGIDDFKWMPDGRSIAFVSWVWPDARGARAQGQRHKAFNERKESAYVTCEPQYRHWDRNLPMGCAPHLLLLDLESGRVVDLLEGTGYELPRADPCAAHFDISPDGRRIAFVHDPSPRKVAGNVFAIAEIELARRRIKPVTDDAAWSYEAPRYSPQGVLACIASNLGKRHTMPGRVAFRRGGKWQLAQMDRDIDVEAPLRWSRDGASIFFTAQERGRCHLWRCGTESGALSIAVAGGWVHGFDVGGAPGDATLLVALDCAQHAVQVHAVRAGQASRLERFNDEVLERVALGETREVTFRGARGEPVQMILTFPPGFDARKRHPVLHVIHGGPYAAAGDTFAYRWNTHLFASRGYVVAAVNYHGSSGFGWRFADSIVGRQGRLETQDIEAATDWLAKQAWVDATRLFASGGSYGGFLVAWMNGHVAAGRYRAYVCHAGVFDRVATFSADSYSQRPKDLGAFYWENPARVRAQSPVTFAHRMQTPTLVMHGANDYRVPDTNGLAYYNTLHARGVPTRLVWFPDEHHWILKPRNSRLWYREFLEWLAAHAADRKARGRG